MQTPLEILINGEPRKISAHTIEAAVAELGLPAPTVLIEHNGNALRREDWQAQVLQAGDRLEILRIAAGG